MHEEQQESIWPSDQLQDGLWFLSNSYSSVKAPPLVPPRGHALAHRGVLFVGANLIVCPSWNTLLAIIIDSRASLTVAN